MNRIVFDTSVAIAILQDEPGREEGLKYLSRAFISAVNVAEIASILSMKALPLSSIRDVISRLTFTVVPLSREVAELAGFLRKQTMTAGLSLGDRTCIALAMHNQLPILTADRAWVKFDFGIPVQLIR